MKERIMTAVAEEIRARGLKFSIRDIADRLGISTKTVYQHFASKEEIVSAIVERSIREMKASEAELLDDAPVGTLEKMRRALVILPGGVAFSDIRVLRELQKLYPKQWRLVDDYMNEGWDTIRSIAEEGIRSGVIRDFDFRLFIRMYVGALYQIMDRGLEEGRRLSLEEALERMVDLLLNGIGRNVPEPAAGRSDDSQKG
ncbi:TetR/AcrR family transcriptional regulator [Paenibacillus sp. GYB003]|uniref:TetR/AcrR family transcriptional regulator n=1 Tax=Paenibacillus sp. GYB003 TaxID=2994392 RepID=UPI002F96720A